MEEETVGQILEKHLLVLRSYRGLLRRHLCYRRVSQSASHPQPDAVILRREDEEYWECWLDTSRTTFAKAQSLLKPYPDELMDAYDVSPIVNSAKYDGPKCITL